MNCNSPMGVELSKFYDSYCCSANNIFFNGNLDKIISAKARNRSFCQYQCLPGSCFLLSF